MDITYWITFGIGGAFVGVTVGSACRWWYSRQLAALHVRLQKAEKARLFASQQTERARKQIEKLQKDLARHQLDAVSQAQTERQRARKPEVTPKSTTVVAGLLDDDSYAFGRPAHGFADTQPMV